MDSKYRKRTIKQESYVSKQMDEKKEFLVYLPPEYLTDKQYSLLILHDGDDYLQLGRIATLANQLILEGEIRPIVIAMIPVDKKKRVSEYDPLGERNSLHKSFIVSELLPYLEQKYAINPSPHKRIIGGSSLGATVSLHTSLDHPEIFPYVLSQSGAFYQETIDTLEKKQTLDYLTIFQSIGDAERAVPTSRGQVNLILQNQKVHSLLKEKGAKVHYVEGEGEHTWGLWQKDLPQALRFFFSLSE